MIAALALAGLLAGAPSAAPSPQEQASGPSAQSGPAARPEKDPMVCTYAKPIGSMLPVKTCVRKSDRARQERESQEALQLIQRRSEGPFKTPN